MSNYCYYNGKFIPEEKAFLSVKDIGLLRGYGVFDFWRTYNAKPFLMKEHLARFFNSAKEVGIKVPYSKARISKIITKLLKRNNKGESTIRTILTGGVSPDGMHPGEKPTFLVLTRDLPPVPEELYKNGVKLLTDEYMRDMPLVKHLNYSNLVKNFDRLNRSGAFNLLYTYNGKVLEAAISNFFIVKKKTLICPKENIMMGTVRNLVLKLVKNKYKVKEKIITMKDVSGCEEAFLTGTTQGVLPVVQVDDKKIGSGRPGPVVKNLIEILNSYIRKNYY